MLFWKGNCQYKYINLTTFFFIFSLLQSLFTVHIQCMCSYKERKDKISKQNRFLHTLNIHLHLLLQLNDLKVSVLFPLDIIFIIMIMIVCRCQKMWYECQWNYSSCVCLIFVLVVLNFFGNQCQNIYVLCNLFVNVVLFHIHSCTI